MSKSRDAMRAIRHTPPWVVVAACMLALALTWLGLKLLSMSDRDSFSIDIATEEFPTVSLSYSVAPFGLGQKEHPIRAEEVAPPRVAARPATLTVTPTGQANARSRGNEVWLVEVSSEYSRVAGASWQQMILPKPWVVSGESALNAQGAPVPLSVGLDAGAYIDARLVTHPWSGRVLMEAGGHSREVDLYSPDSGQNVFRLLLPVAPGTARSVVKTVPRAAGDLTLEFSEGPQELRIADAQRRGASNWTWNPEAADDVVFGPGVKVLDRDSGGLSILVPEGGGWVRLSNTAPPYWAPRLKDLAVILGIWLVVVGVVLLCVGAVGASAGMAVLFGSFGTSGSSGTPVPGRRQAAFDGIILIVVSAWMVALVGGVLLGVQEVAVQAGAIRAARATDAAALVPGWDNIADWLPATSRVRRWWAGRPAPRPDGGDYLQVLSREPGETIADILGVAVARQKQAGVPVEQVIIPRDLTALYGQEPFYISEGVGGRRVKIWWQNLRDVGKFFTDVPYLERDYYPVLTEQQLSQIPGFDGSGSPGSVLLLGVPPEAASGTWVLYALPTTPRTYALVPIEALPTGQRP